MSGHVTLILGGARSGKSAHAERLARQRGRPVLYLATAVAGDEEMAARIAAHRAQRPASWRTVEAAETIVTALRDHAAPGDTVLLDCLTLWVSNVMLAMVGDADADTIPSHRWLEIEARLLADLQSLIATARQHNLTLILVSNEVGMGVVPAFPLGRRFQDLLGRVNQIAAASADTVLLMIAGLPIDLRKLVVETT